MPPAANWPARIKEAMSDLHRARLEGNGLKAALAEGTLNEALDQYGKLVVTDSNRADLSHLSRLSHVSKEDS